MFQDELAKVTEQYRDVSGGVTERQKLLTYLTDSLETTKQEMEERGSSMTDGCKLFISISLVLFNKFIIAYNIFNCYDLHRLNTDNMK